MVEKNTLTWKPILQRWSQFDELLGTEFWVVRDDLLPFPLPGNKVRKLAAELAIQDAPVLITNGGVASNHCRTLAIFAALQGTHAHLVLHGEGHSGDVKSLQMLSELGATFDIGPATTIRNRIQAAEEKFGADGSGVHVISGGGHTRAGALSFRDAGLEVFEQVHFDQVFVASGTGATQGGLIAAAESSRSSPDIIGVSVARQQVRGVSPISEAAQWAGAMEPHVHFLDQFNAGGYGRSNEQTREAVRIGWSHGLPLDYTYTGKAFSAVLDWSRKGKLGSSVLFWHTGGLWNWITHESPNLKNISHAE